MNGLIVVGPTGSGKSTVLKLYQEYLKLDGYKVKELRMNPKSLTKHEFYGSFDENTNSMEDGLLTKHIREILQEIDDEKADNDTNNNATNNLMFLIILDGDVDPVWAENLNSVLDDSKLFTLPSGERLNMPMNVKFIMEADSLE
jgi:dynein heavy chain 1